MLEQRSQYKWQRLNKQKRLSLENSAENYRHAKYKAKSRINYSRFCKKINEKV